MKISQKDLELLVNSLMEELYDKNAIWKEKQSVAEAEWKAFKKTKACKDALAILNNPLVKWCSLDESVFDWTAAEYKSCWRYQVHVWWPESFENEFMSRVRSNVKSNYPDEYTVRTKLRTKLAIELIGWKDLKKCLDEVCKSIKKEFGLGK